MGDFYRQRDMLEWELCEVHMPFQRLLTVITILIVIVSQFLRLYHIDSLPGINGDEVYNFVWSKLYLLHQAPIRWLSGSGNLVNVWRVFESLILNYFFAPSFLLVKVPAMIAGIVAWPILFILARKVYTREEACLLTVLFMCHPVHIFANRFSDQFSESFLLVSAALLLAVAERLTLSYLVLGLSLVAHPTNIFAAPIVFLLNLRGEGWKKLAMLQLGAMVLILWFVLFFTQTFTSSSHTLVKLLQGIDLSLLGDFFVSFIRFVDAEQLYLYVTGRTADFHHYEMFWLALLLLFCVIAIQIRSCYLSYRQKALTKAQRQWWRLCAGLSLSLLSFFILSQNLFYLSPGNLRYMIWALPPVLLLIFSSMQLLLKKAHLATLILSLAALCLCSYWYEGIESLRQYNASEEAFVTGEVEPKEAAYRFIESHSSHERIVIVTSSWWNYWPIKYLSCARDNVVVVLYRQRPNYRYPPDATMDSLPAGSDEDLWFVSADTHMLQELSSRYELETTALQGYGNKVLLFVARAHAKAGAAP
jgi:hypothetical protein